MNLEFRVGVMNASVCV